MNKSRILLLAAALSAGVAAPAFADWDNIGSVFINHRADRDSKTVRLGGSVERLSVEADSSDVMCQSIRATFGNGKSRTIFSGNLYEDRKKEIDLPGGARNLTRLDFNCVARDRSGTKLEIQADIGRYRDEWRRNPEWSRVWARMFSWANMDDDHGRTRPDRWTLLGTEQFTGRKDRETVEGQRGINRIALKPNQDARCDHVIVTFDNGRTRDIGRVRLADNRYSELDLPGQRRDVRRITLQCEGNRMRNVSIGVYGIRDR